MAPSTLQQAAGHLHILLLHGLQVPHGGGLGLRVGRLGHALVDHGAEILPGQLCQIHELLLSDIPQEGGDLGVVDNARQGDPLPGGEDQRVEPHGHHCLHPAEGADDGPGAAGIVRVPWNDPVIIKAILDMGADGIVVPMVCSLEEAKQAAAATHYPPDGIRGMGTRRAVNYGIWDKNAYVADTDKYILTIVQIEHIDVVKDLPEIAKLPGISGFVVGPNDFTMSMNTPERTYTVNDPEVQEQFDKIGQALAGTGKLFGVSGACSEKFVTDWIRRGVNYMCMNFDFNYIVSGAKNVMQTSHAVLDQLGRAY